jgi:AraC-like DNA-binding protein
MRVKWESNSAKLGQSLKVLSLAQSRFSGPLHAHDQLELTWITQGSGLRFTGHTVEPFQSGDLVLIPPRIPHTWQSSPNASESVSAVVLQIELTRSLDTIPEWQRALASVKDFGLSAWSIQGALRAHLTPLLLELNQAEALRALGLSLVLLGDLIHGLSDRSSHDIRRLAAAPISPSSTQAARRWDALLNWIHLHYADALTVNDAAARLHISPGSFSRSFQRRVGRPFSAYVNDIRVANACLLLRQTDRPIQEIAARCGFGALSNFASQFRSRTGTTPREFRRPRSA